MQNITLQSGVVFVPLAPPILDTKPRQICVRMTSPLIYNTFFQVCAAGYRTFVASFNFGRPVHVQTPKLVQGADIGRISLMGPAANASRNRGRRPHRKLAMISPRPQGTLPNAIYPVNN